MEHVYMRMCMHAEPISMVNLILMTNRWSFTQIVDHIFVSIACAQKLDGSINIASIQQPCN
jgi:hypothetical protein